jgi:signal transduction histidine kinase
LAITAAAVLGLDVAVGLSLQHHLDAVLRHRLADRAAQAIELGPGHPARRAEELTSDGITARVATGGSNGESGNEPVHAVAGERLRLTEAVGGGMTVELTASRAPIVRTMHTVVGVEVLASLGLLAIAGFAARAAGRTARAVRAEQAIRRILEEAGHELRTPAANISASAEALLRGECRHHEREELEVAMVCESQRMGRLVADLVDLARGRPVDPQLGTVHLAAVVRRQAGQLRRRSPHLTVTVEGAATADVPGDEQALTRLVANLLDNAAHAAASAGRVTVELRSADDRVELVVSDTGPGIPAGERERIFERFVRLEPSIRRHPAGSGLGLPIARSIARAHGGDLLATDAEAGARFVAWLPVARAPQPAGADGGGSGPAVGPEPAHDSQLSTCLVQSLYSQAE